MEIEKVKSCGKGRRRTPSGNSIRSQSWSFEEVFVTANHSRSSSHAEEDEEALKMAAIERQQREGKKKAGYKQVDLMNENQCIINKLFHVPVEGNGKFLKKIRNRYDMAKANLPTIEVRYEHLSIEADCFIGERALPTLTNTIRNIVGSALTSLGIRLSKSTKLMVLHDASGIIKPFA